ncbi:MAG: hypothetical protein EBU01_10890 [Crocinitomicaceae bacterium]|nr:hypothetical protein [Crocinitomicaceae bacterium]
MNETPTPTSTPVKKTIKIKKTKPKTDKETIVITEDEPTKVESVPEKISKPIKVEQTKEEKEKQIIDGLNEMQKKAYNIAKSHLGTSFNLSKSNLLL